MSLTSRLAAEGLATPPEDVTHNVMYETVVGSVAYGVNDSFSDYDVNGFYVPPKNVLWPDDYLFGFDKDRRVKDHIKCWQQHHIHAEKDYDMNIYSITQYFRLCLDNNPNMLDTLYTPEDCILHETAISKLIRENRDLFPHKQCWPKYRGYATQQLMNAFKPLADTNKRYDSFMEHGYNVKMLYHLVRLLLEAQMIAEEHTIDLRRNVDLLREVRSGAWSHTTIMDWCETKMEFLDGSFERSGLREEPVEKEVRKLLYDCLEMYYGS